MRIFGNETVNPKIGRSSKNAAASNFLRSNQRAAEIARTKLRLMVGVVSNRAKNCCQVISSTLRADRIFASPQNRSLL